MGHALLCIRERMCEIVHWIDAPLIARAVVGNVRNAVDDRIAHVEVWRGHVDLRPQHTHAVLEFTSGHAAEKVKIFFHRPVAIGALSAWLGERAAVFPNFLCC